MRKYSKRTIFDYLWQYSEFYYLQLCECDNAYYEKHGFVSVILLLNLFENIAKSVTHNYDNSFCETINQLYKNKIINLIEYNYLNNKENSVRIIRNILAHANLAGIGLNVIENNTEIFYPFTVNDTFLLLFKKIYMIMLHLIMKIISNEFNLIYDVNLNNDIKKTNINIKTLTSQEYLILKGFSRNCLDGTDIPEDVKLRLIDKSSDVNVYKEIFKSLFQIENENTKSKND